MPEPGSSPGPPTTLWLLRHAEVDEAWRDRAYGDLDVPLSAEGRRVSEARAREFARVRPARVLSSPLGRALHLGRALAEAAGCPLEERAGLRELHRGTWQGVERAVLERERPGEVAAYYADPWGYRGHGGESDAEILARTWPEVERAVEDHPGGTVVVTTHYNVIRVILAQALGVDPPRSFALRVDPAGAVRLVRRPDPGGPGVPGVTWVLGASNVLAPSPRPTEGARP